MSLLNFLCEKGMCVYMRKHKCVRQQRLGTYVVEHDVDDVPIDYFDDDGEAVPTDDDFNFFDDDEDNEGGTVK